MQQTFRVGNDPVKYFLEKSHLRGKIQHLFFLGFLRKNLKLKIAYLGGFLAKNEKNNYGYRKIMKSLLYKSVLRFGEKLKGRNLWAPQKS